MSYVLRHSAVVPARVKAARATVAGVATAVVGVGVAGATASSANASGSVWDRVAACESSGNWSINSGNGFYGGLQFTRSTWLGFGGGQYASSAHLASRTQQIAVAQRVLRVQGPGAWPVCSAKAGLTRSNGGGAINVSRSTGSRTPIVTKKATSVSRSSVKTIQKRVGTTPDGVIGPKTSRAIQRFVGTTRDGVIGPKTVAAMERKAGLRHSGAKRLNASVLAGFASYCAHH